jgi:branched-chain amino acid transport system substrate-binding protein
MERWVNQSGGIRSRPVHFVTADDGSDPKQSVQLTAALVEKHVPVLIGSAVSSMCAAMAPLVEKNGPLTYCLSPLIEPPAGSYLFSAAIGSKEFMPLLPQYARSRGWKRLALMMSLDTTGQDYESKLDVVMKSPDAGNVTIVRSEHFQNTDLSVAAQMENIKASQPDVIVTTATGPAFGMILRAIKDAGIDAPILGPGSNMTYAQLAQFALYLPKTIYFISAAGAKPDAAARGGWRSAQTAFVDAFRLAGIRPEYSHVLVWDPAMFMVDALRKVGPDATAAQLHDYVQQLHVWYGNDGPYDFRAYPQRGLGPGAARVYEWVTAKKDYAVVAQGQESKH